MRVNRKYSYAMSEGEHTAEEIAKILRILGYESIAHYVQVGITQKLSLPEMGRWLTNEVGVKCNRKRMWHLLYGTIRKKGMEKVRPRRLVVQSDLEQMAQSAGYTSWEAVLKDIRENGIGVKELSKTVFKDWSKTAILQWFLMAGIRVELK